MRLLPEAQRSRSSVVPTSPMGLTAVLLAAGVVGIALLATVIIMGPTRIVGIRPTWLATFFVLLAASSLWWVLYLWLLGRLGGLGLRDGLNRSVGLIVLLSLSLIPDLAVFLAGRLPFSLTFDAGLRSLYVWLAGLLVFVVFLGQELVLIGAARKIGLDALVVKGLRLLSVLPSWISRLPVVMLRSARRHPVLVAILAAGIIQRLVLIKEFHAGDMNDTLSVAFTLLGWPPFRYYHDYRPQTYVYAHLPMYQILIAPFYWLFENVAKWPTPWAAKLVSAGADLAVAVLIWSQAGRRWRGSWGVALATVWLLSPLVVDSDDHAVGTAAAFAIVAFASVERSWLCGIMIALSAATRTEAAFLVLPLAVHFVARRDLRESAAFLGAFSTTLATVALPFFLTDPEAMDWAMRLQGQRQASSQVSALLGLLLPQLPPGFASLLQLNPSFFPALLTFPISLLALRDDRVTRVMVALSLVYILTIPVLHPRYVVLPYAGALFYAARYGNPLVAAAIVIGTWPSAIEGAWPGSTWAFVIQMTLVAGLAISGILRPNRRRLPASP